MTDNRHEPEARAREATHLWRVTVSPKRQALDAHGNAVLKDVHELGLTHVTQVASSRLYLIETGEMDAGALAQIGTALLADSVTENVYVKPGGDDRTLTDDG